MINYNKFVLFLTEQKQNKKLAMNSGHVESYGIELDWRNAGVEVYEKDKLIILLDCSFSVISQTRRGGRRWYMNQAESQEGASEEVKKKSETKIIIVAEMEGLMKYLHILHTKYNLTGVKICMYTFSCKCERFYTNILTNPSTELKDLCDNFPTLFNIEGGGTYLAGAIQTIEEEITDNSQLIIATDGQPSDDDAKGTKCCSIISKYQNLSLVMIGAGSISDESKKGPLSDTSVIFRRGSTDVEDFNRFRSASYSECNLDFMFNMCLASKESVYAPACERYELLTTAIDDFLNDLVIKKYAVVLDDQIVDVDSEVNRHLNNDFVCLFNHPQFGLYVITQNWQASVSFSPTRRGREIISISAGSCRAFKSCMIADKNANVHDLKNDYYTVFNEKELTSVILDYDVTEGDLYRNGGGRQHADGEALELVLNKDYRGFCRVRKIIQK